MNETLKADGGAYGAASSATVPPLSLLYSPFSFSVLLWPVFLLVASLWITFGAIREGAHVLEGGGLIVGCIGYLAHSLPLVRIEAQIDGGQVVLRGRRWPGAETFWSCSLQETGQFEVETVDTEEGRFYNLALRTTEGKLLPLTENAYRGVTFIYPKLLNRLNGWLAAVRTS